MSTIEQRQLAFIKALLKAGSATCGGDGLFRVALGERHFSLPAETCTQLASAGVIRCANGLASPTSETRNWLRRCLAEGDQAFAAQHRVESVNAAGLRVNLTESPLARLAIGNYLLPHHLLAGERFRRLVEQAGLRPKVTMTYDHGHVADGGGATPAAIGISDMAVDARVALERIYAVLPAECSGILFDICGFKKGLQQIETERRWPRRSAKLVLRISLEHLAQHFGLTSSATGTASGRMNTWRDAGARPDVFG